MRDVEQLTQILLMMADPRPPPPIVQRELMTPKYEEDCSNAVRHYNGQAHRLKPGGYAPRLRTGGAKKKKRSKKRKGW